METFDGNLAHGNDDLFGLIEINNLADILDWTLNWQVSKKTTNLVWIIINDSNNLVAVLFVASGLVNYNLTSSTSTNDDSLDLSGLFGANASKVEDTSKDT